MEDVPSDAIPTAKGELRPEITFDARTQVRNASNILSARLFKHPTGEVMTGRLNKVGLLHQVLTIIMLVRYAYKWIRTSRSLYYSCI